MTAARASWRPARNALVALCCTGAGAAVAFEQAFDAPAFTVSVPGLPAIRLVDDATAAGALRSRGEGAGFAIEIQAATLAPAASTRTCAGLFLRELVTRPGMPDRDSIYRAPFDAGTFLVLYILGPPERRVLHAHLLSAADGTHCIDAHFSRAQAEGEDEDLWRTTFRGASIRTGGR